MNLPSLVLVAAEIAPIVRGLCRAIKERDELALQKACIEAHIELRRRILLEAGL